jgi:hypothetical protein
MGSSAPRPAAIKCTSEVCPGSESPFDEPSTVLNRILTKILLALLAPVFAAKQTSERRLTVDDVRTALARYQLGGGA